MSATPCQACGCTCGGKTGVAKRPRGSLARWYRGEDNPDPIHGRLTYTGDKKLTVAQAVAERRRQAHTCRCRLCRLAYYPEDYADEPGLEFTGLAGVNAMQSRWEWEREAEEFLAEYGPLTREETEFFASARAERS